MHLFKHKPDPDKLFLEYGDMLYRLALAKLCNDADAQDVVQNVFLKYMTAGTSFENKEHEKAWFLRTAINSCLDVLRKQKVRNTVPLDDALYVAAENQNDLHDLLSLLEQIPPIYKDVVILHSLEGFKLEETASILNISLSAAKMRLSRAKNILQILREEKNDVY